MLVTKEQLLRFLPRMPQPDVWANAINQTIATYDISTATRLAAFLAQVAAESACFGKLVENLNYTSIRLTQVWPTHFKTMKDAEPYEFQPEQLANFIYAHRLGNGDEASGDGWRYRGRGLLQITGRANYRTCGAAIHVPLEEQPEVLETPLPAALSAGQFWYAHGLNAKADAGDFLGITKVINGGTVGEAQRDAYWAQAKAAIA